MLLLEIAAELEGRSLYASADTLEAALPNWREGIWSRIEAIALSWNPAVLLLDELGKAEGRAIESWPQMQGSRSERVKGHRETEGE